MQKKALILSGIPWNTTIQRHHNIAFFLEQLSYEVFFVEGIPSSKFTVNKLIQRIKNHKRNESNPVINKNNIRVIDPKLLNPMGGLFWVINKYQTRQLIKKVGEDFDVVINYLPVNTTCYILDKIRSKVTIYDCVRDFENWGGYASDIQMIEKKIILESDLVLVDSYYLCSKIRNKYPDLNMIQILPTVDKELISILSKCKLNNTIRNILYFGSISAHIDTDILNKLAEDGYHVHIIGKVDHGVILSKKIIHHGFISNLEEMSKKIVDNADAIIIPYKGNMDGVIPAKLMQCFSSGLPIFVNKFYDSEVLKQYLYVYKDYNDLKALVENYSLDIHMEIKKEMYKFCLMNSEENEFAKLKSELEHLSK